MREQPTASATYENINTNHNLTFGLRNEHVKNSVVPLNTIKEEERLAANNERNKSADEKNPLFYRTHNDKFFKGYEERKNYERKDNHDFLLEKAKIETSEYLTDETDRREIPLKANYPKNLEKVAKEQIMNNTSRNPLQSFLKNEKKEKYNNDFHSLKYDFDKTVYKQDYLNPEMKYTVNYNNSNGASHEIKSPDKPKLSTLLNKKNKDEMVAKAKLPLSNDYEYINKLKTTRNGQSNNKIGFYSPKASLNNYTSDPEFKAQSRKNIKNKEEPNYNYDYASPKENFNKTDFQYNRSADSYYKEYQIESPKLNKEIQLKNSFEWPKKTNLSYRTETSIERENYDKMEIQERQSIKEKIFYLEQENVNIKSQLMKLRNEKEVELKNFLIELKELKEFNSKLTERFCEAKKENEKLMMGYMAKLPNKNYQNDVNETVASEVGYALGVENFNEIVPKLKEMLHKIKNMKKFEESITLMFKNCNPQVNERDVDLKAAWKWIKSLVAEYVCLKKENEQKENNKEIMDILTRQFNTMDKELIKNKLEEFFNKNNFQLELNQKNVLVMEQL